MIPPPMVEQIVGMWHGVCNMPGTGSPTTLDVLFRLASTSFFWMIQKWGRGKKLMTGDARGSSSGVAMPMTSGCPLPPLASFVV